MPVPGLNVPRFQNLMYGGCVTVLGWMDFFVSVSVLTFIVAAFFARQVIGFEIGMATVRKISAAIKKGAEVLLNRPYKTAAALLGLLLPAMAYGQNEAGGEAGLKVPDLSTVNFLGMNGHALLSLGLLFCAARPVVWPGDLCAVEEPAGSPHHARDVGTDLRDMQNVSGDTRQVHLVALGISSRSLSRSISVTWRRFRENRSR